MDNNKDNASESSNHRLIQFLKSAHIGANPFSCK